jgi:hypothetical protein
MALKLDMEKAFNIMEWSFITNILSSLGFTHKWVQMISQCISIVSFSILMNGILFGRFYPHRGLRQGDLLSPFLFILGTEALFRLLIKEELSGNIHGIKISCNSPTISRLLYADDLMVFARGNSSEANCVMNCLNKYAAWLGQQVNLAKSSLILSKKCSLAHLSLHTVHPQP